MGEKIALLIFELSAMAGERYDFFYVQSALAVFGARSRIDSAGYDRVRGRDARHNTGSRNL